MRLTRNQAILLQRFVYCQSYGCRYAQAIQPKLAMYNTIVLVILVIISTFTPLALAQEAEPSPTQGSPVVEPSPTSAAEATVSPSSSPVSEIQTTVHEFKRSQIHDIQFDASNGRIFFKVDDTEYDWRPAIEEKAPASVADEISASAAVLEEFRRAPRIIVRVSAKPDKAKHYLVRRLVFVFDSLK